MLTGSDVGVIAIILGFKFPKKSVFDSLLDSLSLRIHKIPLRSLRFTL